MIIEIELSKVLKCYRIIYIKKNKAYYTMKSCAYRKYKTIHMTHFRYEDMVKKIRALLFEKIFIIFFIGPRCRHLNSFMLFKNSSRFHQMHENACGLLQIRQKSRAGCRVLCICHIKIEHGCSSSAWQHLLAPLVSRRPYASSRNKMASVSCLASTCGCSRHSHVCESDYEFKF